MSRDAAGKSACATWPTVSVPQGRTGRASFSPLGIQLRAHVLLALDAVARPGKREQPFRGNRTFAAQAGSIVARIQPVQCLFHQSKLRIIEPVDRKSTRLNSSH